MNPILLTALLSFPALPASIQTSDATASATAPSLEMRLERLVERLEEARVSGHIAGMALAVVHDDEVILTHGFGSADLEHDRPVTPETLFGIGSTTKAFTSTLVGMLVDDGALQWDDPVAEHLPYFTLDTGDADGEVTLRDLLCHRSGFTRMTPLVMKSGVSRENILKTAAQAEPWAPFRKEFHYSNIMFLAAGETAGAVTDSSWDDLVAERIFAPLGMKSSSTTYAAGQASGQLASGYLWDDEKGEYEPKSTNDIDGIGPAGSINSNVIDMARWLRFQLNHGEVEGKQLISEESLEATWTPQMAMGGGKSYGFGWMLHQWDGRRLVEHGGNIGGFAAEVAMLPGEHLGYVLLTNVAVTPLQTGSISIVFDSILGDWDSGETLADVTEVDYDEYVGTYIANFASFRDAEFEVQVVDGKLAVDVPGQQLFVLKNPTDEGRWVFAITDDVQISFERNDSGQVNALTMYQGNATFEAPRQGVEIAAVIPLEDLQRYLGEYESENGKTTGRLLIQNNRLAIEIPGQMTFELHPPNDEDRWVFRAQSQISVAFRDADDGSVAALTLREPGGERELVHLVTEYDEVEPRPTVDELMDLRGATARTAALDSAGSLRLTGTVRFANAGLEGAYEMLTDSEDRYAERLDFGPFGIITSVVAGDSGWSDNPMTGTTDLDGPELRSMMLAHIKVMHGDWRESYDTVSVLGMADEGGARAIKVRLKTEGSPAKTVYIDADTGDIVRADSIAVSDIVQVPTTSRYTDYRTVDGLRLPFSTIIENDWSGRVAVTLESVDTGFEIDDQRFEKSAAPNH
ncbi:MAG: CubicO group peptidase (beta-lactamase class C family) [Chlamydiales bacterium]|jgi:CubicO group peptidase (beta-lactamase class C family)